MTRYDDFAVSVTAGWNDWRSAMVRFADLRDIHWHQPKGAPHPLIHAYVSAAHVVSGDLSHPCDDASVPHHIRACILKSHNMPAVYEELTRTADAGQRAAHVPPSAGVAGVRLLARG
jgi:hypothetical protein